MTPSRTENDGIVGLVAVVLILFVIGAAWGTMRVSERLYFEEVKTRAEATLAVQSATLERHLDKYRLLPALLARRADMIEMIATRNAEDGASEMKAVAGMSGAREAWLLDHGGNLIASNLALPVAQQTVNRAEVRSAIAMARDGRLGRALLTSGDGLSASYLFVSAARYDHHLVGFIGVRVELAEVEQSWALSTAGLLAVDAQGRVVASNVPDWRNLPLRAARDWYEDEGDPIRVLQREETIDGNSLVRLPTPFSTEPFLMIKQDLPVLGWRVAVFYDMSSVREQAMRATIVAVLLCVVAAGMIWIALDRRRRLLARHEEQRANAEQLEVRVRERTRELSEANARLAAEIVEREAAERELQQAQAGLVQSAKLATLGEMSAALSHEFNQPLGAIQMHADNARTLISSDKADKALGNLDKIVAMVKRMAAISQTLKGFTRKAGTTIERVAVAPILDEVLMLSGHRCKLMGVALEVDKGPAGLLVQGGQVRLAQVLMNLIGNALDAMKDAPQPRLRLQVLEQEGLVQIRVEDNGPGIDPEVAKQIFDPFFTTKDVGQGLGLGLSIAYKIMRDVGGTLSYEPSSLGGACFIMSLQLADATMEA
ncbi:ATP-binding protein [Pseudovibrio exalbescens]|uniref:sensor histidine kinase n=1 Tax=Pseudovibrio exalbescens TaxID=197461 RepID=UPI00236627DB|nr:ATP-binding protein [Pseudovibrio exalbescens]MDD7911716.1 ATP-binding protein [Pseudovibrio exalbescens]